MSCLMGSTREDILSLWDECYRRRRFLILDGGEEWPAGSRLTIYRNDNDWALVMEELCFFSPGGGHLGICDLIYRSGSNISVERKGAGKTYLHVTSDGEGEPAFLPPHQFDVNPNVKSIRVRGKIVKVDVSEYALKKKAIPLPKATQVNYRRVDGKCEAKTIPPKLLGQHLLWSLLPENREILLATDEERRDGLPREIPLFIQLDDWHHPPMMRDQLKPSQTETFKLLAEVIVAGDTSLYRPTLPANTDWRNWLRYREPD